MLLSKLAIFTSDSKYVPAQKLVDLLASSDRYQIQSLKRPETDVGYKTSGKYEAMAEFTLKEATKNIFEGHKAAFMFVTPADLSEVTQLTRSFLIGSGETGTQRLAWIAPACPQESDLGKRLAEAESLVRSSNLDTLVLRHAPLFCDLLHWKKELKFRRTLSLPLGSSALPWLAPEIIAEGLYKWVLGGVNNEPPDVLTGPIQLTGDGIAKGLSEALRQNTNSRKFAQRCFQSIDLDRSGQIDALELVPYLLDLGYSNDEAKDILKAADKDSNGAINFEEFIQGLEEHLNKILADVPTEVHYFNVPASTALYDLMTGEMDEKTAKSQLDLLSALNESGLPEKKQELAQWLGRSSISLTDWADQYALDLINVHILPGRGILTTTEGYFEGRPALMTRLLQTNGKMLVGKRTLDNEALELQWADEEANDVVVVRHQPQAGGERVLKLRAGQVVGLSVRGSWLGRRLATQLFFQDLPLPRWQVILFRELGELQIEETSSLGATDDIVCNCTQTTCGKLQALIEEGSSTIEQLAEQTQATMICGGCKPLVEEMLGSASLTVGELVAKHNLGQGMVRFGLRPVHQEVVASKPGQHILIQGRMNGRWVTRAYTLSSAADQTQMYEITVKREETGVFSRWLADYADSDSLFRISEPRGEFFLESENSVLFFAGGIGITPAIAMMRTLAHRRDRRPFHLDWCVPHPEDFVFQPELEQLIGQHSNFTLKLRATRRDGRVSAQQVQSQYPWAEGAVAFMCGPEAYMDTIRSYLKQAGWPSRAIRQELFSSKLDDDGNAEKSVAPRGPVVQLAGGISPVEHDSFDVGPISSVMDEAQAVLKQCYIERGLPQVFLPRWEEVRASIEETGTYEHTYDELVYGARLAWRNSNRCLGRNFWQNLQVRDLRHLETEEEMFHAILEHIKLATNNGDLRATITIFRPDGRRIWNGQYFRYAGYRQPDGTILGDPGNVELTDWALKLGWPGGPRTRFDYLPLIIQLSGKAPRWFEIPPELILEVPFSHPRHEWFEQLDLKWYGLPAVSNMTFDLGGIQYTAAPFNGFYMGAEIGARNFGDTYRYNMLPTIAERLGLDCTQNMNLWKDLALVEMNIAVLHSYKQRGVRMLDHHTLTDSFMRFADSERQCGRPVQADRDYIVPPISPTTTPTFITEFDGNRKLKPNYFYQPEAWKSDVVTQGCPFHS